MRRNMKFLLLFAALASSILAVAFIGGCDGDDPVTITVPVDTVHVDTTVIIEGDDNVIGSVQGFVTSHYDNAPLSGVTVAWTKNDHSYTTTTDANGYYLVDDSLSTGYYELTFTVTGYTVVNEEVYIPTISYIRDGNDGEGDEEYMANEDAQLFPLTATVTGVVYTAIPMGVDKNGAPIMALDDPTLVSVASGVTVVLDYEYAGIHPDKYTATTDVSGVYTFTNVPLAFEVYHDCAPEKNGKPNMNLGEYYCIPKLHVLPFSVGDSAYQLVTTCVEMVPGTTTMPNIFAPLAGDDPIITDRPVILTYNFERPGFLVGDNLTFTFSQPMDSVTMVCDFDFDDYSYTWADNYRTLTVNPALDLVPDSDYEIYVDGYSLGGLRLYEAVWDRNLYTQQGMRFTGTNLDDAGDFIDFPLADAIVLTFDMNVDLSLSTIILTDASFDREVNVTFTGDGTQTVTITPAQPLKSYQVYNLEFEIYSTLRGDYVPDYEVTGNDLEFRTVWTEVAMTAPTDFALDMGTDWVADYNDTEIDFQWNSVPGAAYYEIFAQDDMRNTDRIVVAEELDHLDYNQWQAGTVDFEDSENAQFDLYFDDGFQTPFSDMTKVTFFVRAVNPLGEAGPFSTGITIGDETAPDFTVTQTGNADNGSGAEASTFDLDITTVEYVDSIHFVFSEAGGDTSFVLVEADVEWTWANNMRDGDGEVTVAAGATASADQLIVNIWDNSGNMGADTIFLTPWIIIDMPNDTTADFMAPTYTVEWTSTDPNDVYDWLNMYLSLDGGVTWFDTVANTADDGSLAYTVDDTLYSTTAMVGLQDTTTGGVIWTSDVFTWKGINLTGPDSATYDTATLVYDRGGLDSVGIPIAFSSAGMDSVQIVYSLTGAGGSYTNISDVIVVTAEDMTYTWYPDNRGADYTCFLGIQGFDDTRPIDTYGWAIEVVNDFVNITDPVGGVVPGGADYAVTWTTNHHDTTLDIGLRYTIDSGATYVTIAAATNNDSAYTWAAPATTPSNDSAWLEIVDVGFLNVLDTSGTFSISGIVIDSPLVTSEWIGGATENIRWHTVGTPGTIDFYYSFNNFTTDSTVIVAATADVGTHAWSVPSQTDDSVWIRGYGNTHTGTYTTVGPWKIAGIIVTAPNGGEVLSSGGSTTITWTQVGTAIDSVDFEYSIDGGAWIAIASDTNDGSFTWDPVPNTPSDSVSVRISNISTHTGSDVSDAPFAIAGIIVTAPNGGETWPLTVAKNITWSEISITSNVKIEYTLNLTDWYPVPGATSLAAGTETFSWDLIPANDPNHLATSANCLVRVSEVVASPMTDASNTTFSITDAPAP